MRKEKGAQVIPELGAPPSELIRKRTSCRTYSDQPVEPEKLDSIIELLGGLDAYWGSRVRFELVELGPPGRGRVRGSYGLIRGAGIFLAGAVRKDSPRAMEDYGWLMEHAILHATALGLGTCWIGLTFDRDLFASRMSLGEDELIPAVTPLGYPSRPSLTERMTRATVKARRRKPWRELFFNKSWEEPLSESEAGEYAQALEMVRLGPSATNKQPWRVVKNEDGFHFFLQRAAGYDKLAPGVDMQRIDMGIAMCHFQLACREAGLPGGWKETRPKLELPPRTEYIVSWTAAREAE